MMIDIFESIIWHLHIDSLIQWLVNYDTWVIVFMILYPILLVALSLMFIYYNVEWAIL